MRPTGQGGRIDDDPDAVDYRCGQSRETTAGAVRVGLVADLLEEQWPSMDLVAAMIARHVSVERDGVELSVLRAPFRRRIGWLQPWRNGREATRDRVLNRFWDYPRWLKHRARDYDVLHIVDHSYAQLVQVLPAERTVVTCHDIDAFRQLLPLGRHERGGLPLWLARRVLAGLRAAARVACDSTATRDDLVSHGLVAPERLVVIPNGVDPVLVADTRPAATEQVEELLGAAAGGLCLFHVGSTVARKRIDWLLEIVAAVRLRRPDVWLVRAGGPLTAEQRLQAARLGLTDRLIELPFLDGPVLGAAYRRATLVLQPSEREGFGLPVVESLASGTPVVASDLPVMREVGGDSVEYAPPGQIAGWADRIAALLQERDREPNAWLQRQARGRARAQLFTWAESARRLVQVYRSLAETGPGDRS